MKSPFTTIRTEGGLLPADLLQRIVSGKDLPGLRPEDYHLAANERLNEAISRSWNRLLGVWQSFDDRRRQLPESDRSTTLTRERWLLILFQELGYGRLPYQREGLVTDDGERYPISHVWGRTPIHLITFRQDLDRRDPAIKRTPHGMMQEFLNRSSTYLWGFLSNGLRLRILRDNASLSRAAYVEFDLEGMMRGEVYADFVVLWLVAHQSRVEVGESGDPADCWLERWMKEARESGARALDALRDGVQEAITHLGRGFLAWRKGDANRVLRQRLRTGELTPQDYYRQLLRLVYRLIFLFVAEDRNLLLTPDASPQARERYMTYYSGRRLRRLAAARRGGPHPDLYRTLRLVIHLLREGYEPLGLPGLGGFLFSPEATPDLNDLDIANRDLLEAIRSLAFVASNRVLWPVDFRNLGSEELGSVYESLLELHPQVDLGAPDFQLRVAAGSERKTTGSYYTPTSLINELLDSALEPVIRDRLERAGRIARGEWRIVSSEWLSEKELHHVYQLISRSGRLATRDDRGQTSLSADRAISSDREIRTDLPDSTGSGIHSSQHRGGLGAALPGGVHPVPSPGQRQSHRTGDPLASERGNRAVQKGSDSAPDAGIGDTGKTAREPGKEPASEKERRLTEAERRAFEAMWRELPLATRHSLLAEAMLLDIKVIDPASGSGHFLIAAAHRLAAHLARIRNQDQEPSPAAHREALRDVVRHCIYGVDINPMAVELCKVGLWLESLDPGKPLTFLDRNIQCGNSLVGVTPGLDISIIPDDAFKPVTGDDKKTATALRRRNKRERQGQQSMFEALATGKGFEELEQERKKLADKLAEVEDIPEDDLEDVALKAMYYQDYLNSPVYRRKKDEYDLWTAAFFWPIPAGDAELMLAPTQAALDRLRDQWNPDDPVVQQARAIAQENQFFHWELAFPTVFGRDAGGFDVVLGNPPWEHTELKEKEWFASRRPEIAQAPGAKRKRLIASLAQDDPGLYKAFISARHKADAFSKFVRVSGRYPLCGRGRINTYAIFSELISGLKNTTGSVGIIVPTGIATDDTTKYFFRALMTRRSLVSLYDFENRKKLFPAVDSRMKFCLLTLTGEERPAIQGADFVFFAQDVADLRDDHRHFTLTAEDIELINPNTRTCPIFRSKRDAELTKAIYRRVPVLILEEEKDDQGRVIRPEQNPWGVRFRQGLFNMTSDSHLFRTREQLEAAGYRLVGNRFVKGGGASGEGRMQTGDVYLPLYEAKMIWQFDHRFGTFEGVSSRKGSHLPSFVKGENGRPSELPTTWYWVQNEVVLTKINSVMPTLILE